MLRTKIQLVNLSHHPLPAYKTKGAAGMDLAAFISNPITLQPGVPTLIPTGMYIALPEGLEGQIRARSGLATRHGIIVPNGPGTIDSDYRGEIKVALMNLMERPFEVKDGDRIAQLVVTPYAVVQWDVVAQLSDTARGEGGFGSTGIGD